MSLFSRIPKDNFGAVNPAELKLNGEPDHVQCLFGNQGAIKNLARQADLVTLEVSGAEESKGSKLGVGPKGPQAGLSQSSKTDFIRNDDIDPLVIPAFRHQAALGKVEAELASISNFQSIAMKIALNPAKVLNGWFTDHYPNGLDGVSSTRLANELAELFAQEYYLGERELANLFNDKFEQAHQSKDVIYAWLEGSWAIHDEGDDHYVWSLKEAAFWGGSTRSMPANASVVVQCPKQDLTDQGARFLVKRNRSEGKGWQRDARIFARFSRYDDRAKTVTLDSVAVYEDC